MEPKTLPKLLFSIVLGAVLLSGGCSLHMEEAEDVSETTIETTIETIYETTFSTEIDKMIAETEQITDIEVNTEVTSTRADVRPIPELPASGRGLYDFLQRVPNWRLKDLVALDFNKDSIIDYVG